jgi:hypothetical protein
MRTRELVLANTLVACLGLALVSGCNEKPQSQAKAPAAPSPAMQAAQPEPAPTPEPEVAQTSKPGQLPGDFPSDIPVYPGATSDQGLSIPGQGMLVTFNTVAAPSDVVAFYDEELPKRGWTVQAGDSEHRIVAHKGDREASIMIMASGAQTEIGVSVQKH